MPVVSVQYGNASTDHFTVDVLSTGELSLPAYYYTPVFCLLFTGGRKKVSSGRRARRSAVQAVINESALLRSASASRSGASSAISRSRTR
jgi:hypothetical protein